MLILLSMVSDSIQNLTYIKNRTFPLVSQNFIHYKTIHKGQAIDFMYKKHRIPGSFLRLLYVKSRKFRKSVLYDSYV